MGQAQGGKSGDTGRGSHSLVLARIYPHQLQVKSVAIVALEGDECYTELCLQTPALGDTPPCRGRASARFPSVAAFVPWELARHLDRPPLPRVVARVFLETQLAPGSPDVNL